LRYLHNLEPPIIHFDIKPANVFVTATFVGKLGDVGAALSRDGQGTKAEVITELYAAPEVRRDEGADVSSDVYSLGVMMLEVFTARQTTVPGREALADCTPAQSHNRPVDARRSLLVSGKAAWHREPRVGSHGCTRNRVSAVVVWVDLCARRSACGQERSWDCVGRGSKRPLGIPYFQQPNVRFRPVCSFRNSMGETTPAWAERAVAAW